MSFDAVKVSVASSTTGTVFGVIVTVALSNKNDSEKRKPTTQAAAMYQSAYRG